MSRTYTERLTGSTGMRVGDHHRHAGILGRPGPRRNVVQPAPSSLVMRSTSRISRWPSALTLVAHTSATLTIRPTSRHFCARASIHT